MENQNKGTGVILGLTVLFLGIAGFFVVKGIKHSKEAEKKAKDDAEAKAKADEDKNKGTLGGTINGIVQDVKNIKLDKELGLKVGAAAQSFLGIGFGVKSSPNPKQQARVLVLKKGSKGKEVVELQNAIAKNLNKTTDELFGKNGVDGIFGKNTEKALKSTVLAKATANYPEDVEFLKNM
jgi:hypothetical protein